MKQNLIMAAALACLCASCANDAVIEENRASDEIKFRVFTEGSTRADKVYCPSVAPEEFTVYATDASNKLVIDGDLIKLQSGAYVNTSATRYWPESGKLTFEALLNGTKNTDGKVDFSVAEAVADQKDLIYARAEGSKSSTPVTLNFRHALSQVVFKAANSNKDLTVVVNKVELHNVFSEGTYTLPTALTTTNIAESEGHIGGSYVDDGSRGSWNNTQNTLADYTVTPTSAITLSGIADATDISEANSPSALMLIPGEYTAWDKTGKASESDGTYFILNVKITQKVNSTETATTIWDGDVAIPVNINWAEGKRYVYTFAFGKGNGGYDPENPDNPVFVPITFNVTVDEFVPVDSEIEAGGK